MTNFRYSDATNTVANRNCADGSMESWLVHALPEGTVIEPYIPPVPTPAELLAKLDADNALTQRNLRNTIQLMAEAFKQLSNGAVDLSAIPGVAKVYEVEAQATVLRNQL